MLVVTEKHAQVLVIIFHKVPKRAMNASVVSWKAKFATSKIEVGQLLISVLQVTLRRKWSDEANRTEEASAAKLLEFAASCTASTALLLLLSFCHEIAAHPVGNSVEYPKNAGIA